MRSGDVVAGKYRLDRKIGTGGMGQVWSATHTGTGREFAVKFMHAHAAASENARERFAREARASAQINHPNIIDVFDVGEMDDGVLYLVMELLDGVLLVDAFSGSPPLSVRDLLAIMLDVASALAAAHAAGIVHRDIKPENVFLHKDRGSGLVVPKLLDFGIGKFASAATSGSKATAIDAVLGSPRYMSPEQTRSAAAVDHRADLWACGVILFEAITGTFPHEGDSFSTLVLAINSQPPTSIDLMVPDLPEPVRSIIRDCLKPLGQRLATAAELVKRIEAALREPGIAEVPLARPLEPAGGAPSMSGLRFRAPEGPSLKSGPSLADRAALSSRGGAPSSSDDKFHAISKTLPLQAMPDLQRQIQAQIEAAKAKTPGFTPQARTAKIDADMLASVRAQHPERRSAPMPPPEPTPMPPSRGAPQSLSSSQMRAPQSLGSSQMHAPPSLGSSQMHGPPPSLSSSQMHAAPPSLGSSQMHGPPSLGAPPAAMQSYGPGSLMPMPASVPMAAPAPVRSNRSLGLIAAVLVVVLTGIVIALVSTLSSDDPPAKPPAPASQRR